MDSHSENTIEKEAINDGDKKSIKNAFRSLIIEYCSNSTVHGVKYLSCKRRTLFEKIWWIATFLLSTFVCWWLIHNIYRKWQEMPVMVSIAEKPTMVWEIPFPAVTICPETKALSQYLNFNEIYEKILSYTEKYNDTDELNGTIHRNIDEVTFDQYLALSQLCFRNHRFVLPLKLKTDPNCVEMLRNVSMPIRDMMKSCYFQEAECAEDFLETITDDGICLTFNSLSVGDLLRVDQLHSNYEHMSGRHEVSHWTLEKGYPDMRLSDRYPKPVGDAFLGLDIILHLPEYIEDECRVFYMDKFAVTPIGFTVMLHSPNEYPSGSSYYIAIPLNYQVQLVVQPLMMTTSDGLRSYNVENRQCFYNHERYLRFFKEYTQQNCEMECISNYTLHKCGCVKFWMMRDNQTGVCGTSMINCYTEARYEIMKQHAKQLKEFIIDEARIFKSRCNCLPACTSLQYKAEVLQVGIDAKSTENKFPENSGSRFARLCVYFKENQFTATKRSEMYTTTDFIASCGGLLGLFMGISFLSITELLYYCFIRPFHMLRKDWTEHRKKSVVFLPPTEVKAEEF